MAAVPEATSGVACYAADAVQEDVKHVDKFPSLFPQHDFHSDMNLHYLRVNASTQTLQLTNP